MNSEQEAELFRLLVENVKDYAIFVVEPQGSVQTWNSGAEHLLAYREDEIVGQPVAILFTPEDIAQGVPQQEIESARNAGRANDDRWHVRKDGSRFWAGGTMTPLWDEAGQLRGFAKIMRDRTEWKVAQDARRGSEAREAAIIATALDAIISIDHHGHVLEFNPAAERLFGHPKAVALGRDIGSLIVPERLREAHYRGLSRYLATGEGPVLNKRLELPALRADGTEVLVELAITRIPGNGEPTFTAYLRDISQAKQAEQYRSLRLAVTQALVDAGSVESGAALVLQAVCETLDWDLGFLWLVSEGGDSLLCRKSWHRAGSVESEFESTSCGRTFAKGEGLPGRVWSSGQPSWIVDVLQDKNFPRISAAAKEGLHSALACPIVVGEQTTGVVEFFTKGLHNPSAELLETLATVTGQIGQFIERRKAEESLHENEQRFRGLMEQAPFSVQMFSPEGQTLSVNRAWEELWGVTLDQVADYNILEDRQLAAKGVLANIQRAFAGEPSHIPAIQYDPNETIPDRTRHTDALRWVAAVAYPLKDEAGRIREVVLVHDDITARKRAEEALHESQEHYRAIGESMEYGVWVCDAQGRNTYASESFLNLIGLTQEECSEFGWADKLLPADAQATIAAWQECVRTGGRWDREHTFLGVDGAWHSVLARGVAVKNDRGEITAWVGINLDISRLKQVEQELRDADRRKDEFLATLAHELRNPLAPIRNSLQILKMPQVDAVLAAETRDVMERQVHHLVRLVDDLLDVSRVMRGKIELRKEPVELATVVARALETAKPLIEVQGHKLDVSLPAESLLLMADPVRLAQVIGNLLTNSAKYTEANGHIWVTAIHAKNQAVLTVRDNGIGIDPEVLPHVFDLFVQADHASTKAHGGLGIGLTLVKNLVEMHGGTVTARSDGLGRGAEFEVRLPLVVRPSSPTTGGERQQKKSRTPASGHRLLVVDDNQDAAVSLAMLLRLQGHEVRVAHDGPTALETARNYCPDLVFLDLGMPGMDGYEVARHLRQTPGLESTVLAALTGWGQQDDRRRTAEAGFDHHLVKPPEQKLMDQLLADLKQRRSALKQ